MAEALRHRDVVKQRWVTPGGTFTVMIGRSSRQIVLTATFTEKPIAEPHF